MSIPSMLGMVGMPMELVFMAMRAVETEVIVMSVAVAIDESFWRVPTKTSRVAVLDVYEGFGSRVVVAQRRRTRKMKR
jgi:hypothetical protein